MLVKRPQSKESKESKESKDPTQAALLEDGGTSRDIPGR